MILCHWFEISFTAVVLSRCSWKKLFINCAPFFAVVVVVIVYLPLEPTSYRNRLRNRNYFPQWSEYVCSRSSSSVTLDLLKRKTKQKQWSGSLQAGVCGLFVNFHTFFSSFFAFHPFPTTLSIVTAAYWGCDLIGAISVYSILKTAWRFVLIRVKAACGEPRLLNAGSAWPTRLFLVGDTGKLGKRLHGGAPPLSDPYFYQAQRRRALWILFTSKYWTSPFPLHFQPGNLHTSSLLSSLLPVCLSFCWTPALFFSLFLINRLMWSIFSSQLPPRPPLLSNLTFPWLCSGVMGLCYRSVSYCWVCDPACCCQTVDVHVRCRGFDQWW